MQEQREKIRILMTKYRLNFSWLINELDKRGVQVSASEMSDILNCRRRGEKSFEVINRSLEILEKYRICYVEA